MSVLFRSYYECSISYIFKVELMTGSFISVSTMSIISRSDTDWEKIMCCFVTLCDSVL